MEVFGFENFREYIHRRIQALPGRGRGENLKIAKDLRIHSTTWSQILSGKRGLGLDQACRLAAYFGLNRRETEYFILLAEMDQAESKALRQILRDRLERIKNEAPSAQETGLDDREQGIYYSNWQYGAVRLATLIPEYQTLDQIAEHFRLSLSAVRQIVDFLVSAGLCVETSGHILAGRRRTNVGLDSPHLDRHHMNWRIKALEAISRGDGPSELRYTSPMSVSEADVARVRSILINAIQEVDHIIDQSADEKLVGLNIDLFSF